MGLRDWFRRKPRGREYWVREDFRDLPMHEWTDDEYDHFMATCSDDEYWRQWETWSRQTRAHPGGVRKIRRDALDFAREAARDTDRPDRPREFACMLAVEGDTITELVLLPGTVSGDEHAIFEFYMQPVDRTVRGTLHSHPDEHPYPSDADFELFGAHGEVHLILCRPYGPEDWRAYDHTGHPVHLEVVRGERRPATGGAGGRRRDPGDGAGRRRPARGDQEASHEPSGDDGKASQERSRAGGEAR